MLFVLSLDWQRFSISDQVVEANHYLKDLSSVYKVAEKVSFNSASIKAGEHLLPFANGELGKNEMPRDDTLDYLRWHHQKVREVMWEELKFRANRDLTEMLSTLKSNGHKLAAVLPSRTSNLEEMLEEARIKEYFENAVYGYDRRHKGLLGNVTLASLFATAVEGNDENYEETVMIADSPEAVSDATPLQSRAVVGYLDPYVPWEEQGVRLNEMQGAGANFAVVGGHYVTALPWYLKGKSEQIAKETLAGLRLMNHGPH